MTEPTKLPPLPDAEFPGVIIKGTKAIPRYLFTANQLTEYAQAYADAKVREALEKAVSICEAAYGQGSTEYAFSQNPYFEGGCDAIEFVEQSIRSLIPKEPT